MKTCRTNYTRGYELTMTNLPPPFLPAPSDVVLTLQDDGSQKRVLIPLRTYLGKKLN